MVPDDIGICLYHREERGLRNHEQLRRILPQGRCDFDRLTEGDVSLACSNVNSYPLTTGGGRCGFKIAPGAMPESLFDALGMGASPQGRWSWSPQCCRMW